MKKKIRFKCSVFILELYFPFFTNHQDIDELYIVHPFLQHICDSGSSDQISSLLTDTLELIGKPGEDSYMTRLLGVYK
jgi:hypothetical protein